MKVAPATDCRRLAADDELRDIKKGADSYKAADKSDDEVRVVLPRTHTSASPPCCVALLLRVLEMLAGRMARREERRGC